MTSFFVSDLHGQISRYETLFARIREEKPVAVFLGGDLFPPFGASVEGNFLDDILAKGFIRLKGDLGLDYPRVFLILGNDDSKTFQEDLESLDGGRTDLGLRPRQIDGVWILYCVWVCLCATDPVPE